MKKLESTLVNMVAVLVGVAVITGGLLAWVNHVTEGPIKLQDEMALANGIKEVMCADDLKVTADDEISQTFDGKELKFVVHKVADGSGKFLGAAVESVTMGFGGDLKVLVGFDAEGNVLGYTILQASETPGLGAKADKWFQADGKGSIIGKKADNPLKVKNDDGDVEAITASTITSRAFLKAVNQAYQVYAGQDRGQDTDGSSGASQQAGKHHQNPED